MIRILIDTNVVVSTLISGGGPPAALIDLWHEGEFDIVVTPMLLTELRTILDAPRLRKWVTSEDADEFISLLHRSAELVSDPDEIPRICRDSKDDFLFAGAAAGACQAICSGDLDLASVVDPPIPVLSPAALLERLRS